MECWYFEQEDGGPSFPSCVSFLLLCHHLLLNLLSCFLSFLSILFSSTLSPHLFLLFFYISSFLTFQVSFLVFSPPLLLLIFLCSHILQLILLFYYPIQPYSHSLLLFLYSSTSWHLIPLLISISLYSIFLRIFHVLVSSSSSLQKSSEPSSSFILLLLFFLISTYFFSPVHIVPLISTSSVVFFLIFSPSLSSYPPS